MPTHLPLVLLMALALAQQGARDPAGTRPIAPSGTARISGVVVETATPAQPVRRAILTLTGPELPAGRATISDDQGRFTFDNLPAGRFALAATKAAYLAGAYGSASPLQAGVPLQLAAGQTVGNVRISLTRGAAITGIVSDQTGESASGTQVAAYRVPAPGLPPNLTIAGIGLADDRGVYRIFGLMPGRYVVASTRPVSARLSDVAALSSSEIDRALRELQERADAFGRGSALPTAPAVSSSTPAGAYDFSPVFHPGTASPAAATRIVIQAGEERTGVDFAIGLVRMARIQGSVIYPPGPPPTTQFAIRTDGLRLPALSASVPTFTSKLEPPGRTFVYTNAAPGRYVISVRTRSGDSLYSRAEVEVSGEDVTGLSLVLQPTLTLAGRVVFDGASQAPSMATVAVTIRAANDAGGGASGSTQLGNLAVTSAAVGPDGRFALTGILPDAYRLTTSVPESSGWWLRSAMVNGRDVLDDQLEIAPGRDLTDAVLTFSDRPTTISGTLVTAGGQVAPEYFIAVVPANRALWSPGSRRIRSARAGTDGRRTLAGLPPGDYLVAALTELESEQLLDPVFLEQLVVAAVKVSLKEGEARTQDLRVGR